LGQQPTTAQSSTLLAANIRRSLDKQNPQPSQQINHEGGFRSMNIPSLP
jgi:hypothetical protein